MGPKGGKMGEAQKSGSSIFERLLQNRFEHGKI